MKITFARAALAILLFAPTLILRAEPPGGVPQGVPAALPSADRVKLGKWRAKIVRTQTLFEDRHQAVLAEYDGIRDEDPRAGQARAARETLETEANGIIDQVDNYTEALGLALRIQDASRQVAEISEQLRGWGFKQREAEFVRYGGLAGQARDRLIAQLTSRVQGLVTSKTEALMQETFLEKIRTMKRKDVNRLAEQLSRAGLKDHDLQMWLRSFSEKAPRAVLVQGAKDAIACLKYEENLFKLAETDAETMAGRQEAVLTLASMMIDHKYLAELKAVAGGLYDVGEAGVTLYILNEGVDHLNQVTDQQLAAQKIIVGRMKSLVDRRTADTARYAALAP
ncbi:MAG: hypothetical protein Q8J74_03665 [Candidatus Didemnitutus sp.]|nr:hypothetical protein [Candidatus Didemnitutus sp.]